ncbi:hypothetical protein AB6887_11135 [Carnobacterium divergens]|uniref:Uncharacterized protein n=1 Tax=Carnobacterium divergens TaxID=2748 RepID=A0A7Z8G5C9_CARDV|nr:hypothetical protein [Carnobacterium divergens]MPQ22966.1 hypothetical protein [Carnobacterium divergens]TFI74459.1 hypothetical protein CKN58_04335 [Carnobacterium divergens]TFI78781.1 hypothetical protein CKN85_04330 [Carnobacterium divergens]TFI85340.1 hypothetical protein CKN56_04305 [Carnobacterium divergens]TFI97696.1 hypothetical protein CKN64_04305 [Carnobacterium divergens]
MRIEDNWIEGFLYYIEFRVETNEINRNIKKIIILHEELDKIEVIKIIKSRFSHVKEVIHVDLFDEVLLPK